MRLIYLSILTTLFVEILASQSLLLLNNKPSQSTFNNYNKLSSKDILSKKKRSTLINHSVQKNEYIKCTVDNFMVIDSQEELNNFSNCNEIIGDLIISNNFNNQIIDLEKIQSIQGNLIITDLNNLIKFKAINLQSITGNFILNSLTSLVSLEIPNLSTVNSINWEILPILNYVELNDNIFVQENIIISDTSISNIEGFQKIKEINIFNINNNRYLETIKTNLKLVHKQFSVHANSKELELEMPFLQHVENMTIRDTQAVWFPNLNYVNTNLEFIENDITDLYLPNLIYIGGTLGIIDNLNLKNLNLNNVTEIQGGLMIDNNNRIECIDFLKNLKTVGGAIHFDGNFKDTNFENLKLVKGSAYIMTLSDEMDCNKWIRPPNGRSIIRGGKIKCTSSKKQNFISLDENGKVLDMTEKDLELDNNNTIKEMNRGTKIFNETYIKSLSVCLLLQLVIFFFV